MPVILGPTLYKWRPKAPSQQILEPPLSFAPYRYCQQVAAILKHGSSKTTSFVFSVILFWIINKCCLQNVSDMVSLLYGKRCSGGMQHYGKHFQLWRKAYFSESHVHQENSNKHRRLNLYRLVMLSLWLWLLLLLLLLLLLSTEIGLPLSIAICDTD